MGRGRPTDAANASAVEVAANHDVIARNLGLVNSALYHLVGALRAFMHLHLHRFYNRCREISLQRTLPMHVVVFNMVAQRTRVPVHELELFDEHPDAKQLSKVCFFKHINGNHEKSISSYNYHIETWLQVSRLFAPSSMQNSLGADVRLWDISTLLSVFEKLQNRGRHCALAVRAARNQVAHQSPISDSMLGSILKRILEFLGVLADIHASSNDTEHPGDSPDAPTASIRNATCHHAAGRGAVFFAAM